MTTIKPTQRDRDAAASGYFAWCSGNPVIPSKMQSGRADDHSMVQAFARHAAAERAIGYRMGIEAAAKALEDDAQLCDCHARSEGECACGAWSDYKTVPMERAVDIVRALSDNAEAIARGE